MWNKEVYVSTKNGTSLRKIESWVNMSAIK